MGVATIVVVRVGWSVASSDGFAEATIRSNAWANCTDEPRRCKRCAGMFVARASNHWTIYCSHSCKCAPMARTTSLRTPPASKQDQIMCARIQIGGIMKRRAWGLSVLLMKFVSFVSILISFKSR